MPTLPEDGPKSIKRELGKQMVELYPVRCLTHDHLVYTALASNSGKTVTDCTHPQDELGVAVVLWE